MREITIDNYKIGGEHPCFIVAELSANHNQDFDIAVNTIKAAKEAGADAIKLQTYTPDTLTIDCNTDYFTIKGGTIWDGQNLYELYQKAYTPWEWHPKLKQIADELGLAFFSTPFDKTSVDFLEELGVNIYKVASFEITDISLIEYIANKNKPIMLSTGVAALSDINDALAACYKKNNNKVILLKCTSAYPAPFEEMNLKMIPDMEKRFQVTVGLSDHTLGDTIPSAAVALGAKVIEKHFILNRNLGGPDKEFSIEPDQFKQMVMSIRSIEKSLGKITYELSEKIKQSRLTSSRSLFFVENMKKGEPITENNVRSIRPGFGIPPKHLNQILGMKVKRNIARGTPLRWELIEGTKDDK